MLGVQDNINLKNQLGFYPIPNKGIDSLLGTNFRTPLMVPLDNLGLGHPVQLPGLHLQKHEFQVGYSFSGRIGFQLQKDNAICLPTLRDGCSPQFEQVKVLKKQESYFSDLLFKWIQKQGYCRDFLREDELFRNCDEALGCLKHLAETLQQITFLEHDSF